MIYFNSRDLKYKKPFGAVRCGSEVHFFVNLSDEVSGMARLVIAQDGGPPEIIEGRAEETGGLSFSWISVETGLYFYHFEAIYGDKGMEMTGTYQLTVYEHKEEETADWLSCGLMYQIFPDRFARSKAYALPEQEKNYLMHEQWGEAPVCGPDANGTVWNNDFFGGNLLGILEQLPYLESLGVTVLYLNPIFKAFSNHRYDTGDYKTIDPMLGAERDFEALCKEALNRGIKIIFDGVFNHTGSDSLYFNKYGSYHSVGAYQDQKSPYYKWYRFSEYPDKYESWWGIDTLPSLNETDPSCLNYLIKDRDSVVRRWLAKGASGVRLDVADELPDEFLDELRKAVKAEKKDALIIGEVWEDASNKISYGQRRRYFQGKQLDSVMNYPVKDAIIRYLGYEHNGTVFAQTVESLWENYPPHIFNSLMNILGTHDTKRILTVFLESSGNYEDARQKLFSALLLWAFLPGIPCLYYGDEIGMEGDRDPLNRQCFCPEKANDEIAAFYRRVLSFRNKIPQIERMEYVPAGADDGFYSFFRRYQNKKLIVAVNDGYDTRMISVGDARFIVDFVNSGNVHFADRSTFAVRAKSGIAILLSE